MCWFGKLPRSTLPKHCSKQDKLRQWRKIMISAVELRDEKSKTKHLIQWQWCVPEHFVMNTNEHCSKVLIWEWNNRLITHLRKPSMALLVLTSSLFPSTYSIAFILRFCDKKSKLKRDEQNRNRRKIPLKSVFASPMPTDSISNRSIFSQSVQRWLGLHMHQHTRGRRKNKSL